MDDVELLATVLDKTTGLIEGVRPDQLDGATPCPEMDVSGLIDHLVGGSKAFAGAATGQPVSGDAFSQSAGDRPAEAFAVSAGAMVEGWRREGTDREVTFMGPPVPGDAIVRMSVMEYLAHGWDLARATGQDVPYTEDEARQALAMAEQTLPPEYRGPGKAFGDIVEVAPDAPAVDRFAAFLGRDPRR